jgi:hypothetical protein
VSDALEGVSIQYFGFRSNRDNPERAVISFQVGSADTTILISVEASLGNVEIHSLTLRENGLLDPGFERTDVGEVPPWIHDSDPTEPVILDETSPYAGIRSACLDSAQAPNVLRQAPGGMRDDNLYLFGGQFNWDSTLGVRPAVHISNGSLFASGAPYSDRKKAIAQAGKSLGWQTVATVGRRLLDTTNSSGLDNIDDMIRFGTGSSDERTNFCLDSTFNIALDVIQGSVLPSP